MRPFSRSDRVGGLIKEVMGELLRKQISDPRLAKTVITDVEVTRDLRLAARVGRPGRALGGRDGLVEAPCRRVGDGEGVEQGRVLGAARAGGPLGQLDRFLPLLARRRRAGGEQPGEVVRRLDLSGVDVQVVAWIGEADISFELLSDENGAFQDFDSPLQHIHRLQQSGLTHKGQIVTLRVVFRVRKPRQRRHRYAIGTSQRPEGGQKGPG